MKKNTEILLRKLIRERVKRNLSIILNEAPPSGGGGGAGGGSGSGGSGGAGGAGGAPGAPSAFPAPLPGFPNIEACEKFHNDTKSMELVADLKAMFDDSSKKSFGTGGGGFFSGKSNPLTGNQFVTKAMDPTGTAFGGAVYLH